VVYSYGAVCVLDHLNCLANGIIADVPQKKDSFMHGTRLATYWQLSGAHAAPITLPERANSAGAIESRL
jgi:hypothetical protein